MNNLDLKNKTFLDALFENNHIKEEYFQFNNVNIIYKNSKAFESIKNYEKDNGPILNNRKFELFKDLGVFSEQFENVFKIDHLRFQNLQHDLGISEGSNNADENESVDVRIEGVTKLNVYLKKSIEDISSDELRFSKLVI